VGYFHHLQNVLSATRKFSLAWRSRASPTSHSTPDCSASQKSIVEWLDANSGACRLRGERKARAAGNDIYLPPTFQIHKKLASQKLVLEGGERA